MVIKWEREFFVILDTFFEVIFGKWKSHQQHKHELALGHE